MSGFAMVDSMYREDVELGIVRRGEGEASASTEFLDERPTMRFMRCWMYGSPQFEACIDLKGQQHAPFLSPLAKSGHLGFARV